MIAVLTLVSGAGQNAIGGPPHEQIRLPGSAVDVRLAGRLQAGRADVDVPARIPAPRRIEPLFIPILGWLGAGLMGVGVSACQPQAAAAPVHKLAGIHPQGVSCVLAEPRRLGRSVGSAVT